MADETPKLSANVMAIVSKALSNQTCISTFTLASVGMIREDDSSGIEEAADFLIRREGVETVVVFGIVDSSTLVGSLHTTSGTVEPEKWIRTLLEEDESLEIEESDAALCRFHANLGLLGKCKEKAELWKITEQFVTERFVEKIGVVDD